MHLSLALFSHAFKSSRSYEMTDSICTPQSLWGPIINQMHPQISAKCVSILVCLCFLVNGNYDGNGTTEKKEYLKKLHKNTK